MNEKGLKGLLNTSPEKRYKSFLSTVADLEEVWLLFSKEGYATFDEDDFVHLLVWPRQEFAEMFKNENEEVVSIEVHKFIEQCETLEENIRFMVFPTDKDSYVVTAEKLINDINEALEEVE